MLLDKALVTDMGLKRAKMAVSLCMMYHRIKSRNSQLIYKQVLANVLHTMNSASNFK